MAVELKGPIPGESLTREPGNAPWEQPPKFAELQQALAFYMDKFSDPEKFDDAMFLLGQGFPVDTFVESMLTVGVMEGYHSIDVSTLAAPVLHEYFTTMGSALGLPIVEEAGPTAEERQKVKDKRRMSMMIENSLTEEPSVEQRMAEAPPTEEEMSPPIDMKKGLVSRREPL